MVATSLQKIINTQTDWSGGADQSGTYPRRDNQLSLKNHCLRFDGLIHHGIVGNYSITQSDFTVEFFAVRDAEHAIPVAFSNGIPANWATDLFLIYIGDGGDVGATEGDVRIWWGGDIIAPNTTNLADGVPRHYAVVRQGETITVYINGNVHASGSTAGRTWTSSQMIIGCADNNGDTDQFFDGTLSDMRVWTVARSQAEIQADIGKRLTGQEANLKFYWPMDEGEGNVLYDLTGTQNVTTNTEFWETHGGVIHNPVNSSHAKPLTPIGGTDITVWFRYHYRGNKDLENNATENWNTLFCHDGGTYHHLIISSSFNETAANNLGFFNSGYFPSYGMVVGGLYDIAFVKSGTNQKIYVNGVLQIDSNESFDNALYPIEVFFNYSSTSPDQGCIGELRDIRIWNRVLSSTEINDQATLNTHQLYASDNGLIHWYPMKSDTVSGGVVQDVIGGNDLTLNGGLAFLPDVGVSQEGSRTETSALDLSEVGRLVSSTITWSETLQGGTVVIEVSYDGGSVWHPCTNGNSIPELSIDQDLRGMSVLVRQTLSTTTNEYSPLLNSLTLTLNGTRAMVKRWDGVQWVNPPPKIWDGNQWVVADPRVFTRNRWL